MAVKKLVLTLILAAVSVSAFAAGDGHGTVDMGAMLKNFGYRVLVFVLFVIILFKLLKKPLLEFLDKRAKDIDKSIQTAKEANETAKTEIESYKLKMKGFEKDLETMKQRALEAAENEKKAIIEDAEKQIEKLGRLAESRIQADYKKASEELKKHAVASALEAAQAKLGQELTPEKQNEILGNYIKKLGVIR